jgi:two-component system, OmpR family, KDP operon response regulator KdpE
MSFKLLIAEDARDVAEVVAFGARMAWPGCQVTIAADGAEALQVFTEDPPDLVVLDVEMPKVNGFEVCQRMRVTSQVPILMLTVRDSTLDKVRALDLGADDYLTKPFDHLELLARLRALVRRSRFAEIVPGPALTVGELHLDFTTHEVRVRDEVVHLTSTEYRLLEELVRNAGIVLTHRVLLDRVWGPEYGGDTQYLKVFVRRLRQKLGDDAAHPRYIQTEWGIGYRFVQLPTGHA